MTEFIVGDFFIRRGEIVRCRDCKHYRKYKWANVVVGSPVGRNIIDVCMLFADDCKVEPNGFCAWGERR